MTGAVAVGAALLLTTTPLLVSPAVAADPPGIVNGDGEDGTTGFSVSSGATLANSTKAHSGRASIKMSTTEPLAARLDATTSPGLTTVAGATSVARVWVRTATLGQSVQLRLLETQDGATVQRVTSSATPLPYLWAPLEVELSAEQTGSALKVQVASPEALTGVVLRVDDLTLTSSGDPGPAPAPPAPPTGPAPAPAPGAGTLTNGCSYNARGLPSCGAYLGASYGANTVPTALESVVGRRLGVRRTFYTAAQVDAAVDTARLDVSAGRLPWISFKLPHSWEDMTAGAGDAWARDIATQMRSVPGPVWLAFHHEPEGDGDIDAWRTTQERLAPIVRGAAPNVAYTVILTGWNQFYGDSSYSLANVWPRGVKIDVAGFDLYNEYGVTKNGNKNTKWPDFDAEYFTKIEDWAADQGVEWGVAETAYTDEAHALHPDWIKTTYGEMVARGGVAMAYFDTELNAFGSWPLTSLSKRLALAAALLGSAALPLP